MRKVNDTINKPKRTYDEDFNVGFKKDGEYIVKIKKP